jgi:hypothetical protein
MKVALPTNVTPNRGIQFSTVRVVVNNVLFYVAYDDIVIAKLEARDANLPYEDGTLEASKVPVDGNHHIKIWDNFAQLAHHLRAGDYIE